MMEDTYYEGLMPTEQLKKLKEATESIVEDLLKHEEVETREQALSAVRDAIR